MRPLAGWLVLCAISLAGAARAETRSAEEIQECVRANLPSHSSIQTVLFRSTDRVGAVTESRATIHWKKFEDGFSRILLRFTSPPDLRGSALLMIEKKEGEPDMFMYLPELAKVRRVTGRTVAGSMFGTDFSYEQFQRMQGLAVDSHAERLPDAQWGGKNVEVLTSEPAPDSDSQFKKVISYVDPETCVTVKSEYFESGERLRKALEAEASEIVREKKNWVPRLLTMRDLRDETQTELHVESIELDVEISKHLFSQGQLLRGR